MITKENIDFVLKAMLVFYALVFGVMFLLELRKLISGKSEVLKMVATSNHRGHKIYFRAGEWFYFNTGEPVSETYKKIGCGYCGNKCTDEGHDSCLGTLPGIMNACCGHGKIEETYIQFLDGHSIRGQDAKVIIDILKKRLDDA